jgi:hypothetical protein
MVIPGRRWNVLTLVNQETFPETVVETNIPAHRIMGVLLSPSRQVKRPVQFTNSLRASDQRSMTSFNAWPTSPIH